MKTRILSLLLCICLLFSAVALFSSCSLGGSKDIELKGYNLIYAEDASDSLDANIATTHKALQEKTGETVGLIKVKGDSEDEDLTDYEILVGNTGRKETNKALRSIRGHGYTIKVIKNKIVIVGTTNFLTMLALQKFNDLCLTGEKSAVLTVEKVRESKIETLSIADQKWAFVHSPYLDEVDFVPKQIAETKEMIGKYSSIRGTAMKIIADTSKNDTEIIVGVTNRAEGKEFMVGMDALDYGVGVKNGKVIIAGLGDTALSKAFILFRDMLRDSVVEVDDEKIFVLPADFSLIFTDTENAAFTDFPRPEGLVLSGTADVHDGTEFYYEGKGVSLDAYKAYCEKLVAAGYRLYGKANDDVEGSYYRTYVNEQAGGTLYVAYSAYTHRIKQDLTDVFSPAIRVVSARLDAVNLVDEQSYNFVPFDRVQNSSITAVELFPVHEGKFEGKEYRYYGNIYIMTLEDGSFVLFDAGRNVDGKTSTEIYKTLLALYLEGHDYDNDGVADTDEMPTEENPIRIAAWVFSHGHSDHVGAFESFINNYCAGYGTTHIAANKLASGIGGHRTYVTIDRLISNFTSDEEHYADGSEPVRDKYATLAAKVKDAEGKEAGFKYYKVHTGQKFWLANVEFEVILTHEDIFPQKIHIYNNASTVIRTTMYYTDDDGKTLTDKKASVLWLGDAQTQASQSMRALYGEALQSDMLQYAHHGFSGCEWKFYQLVKPKLVWWPQGELEFEAYVIASGKSATSANGVNYRVINELKSLQYIILSMEGNYTLTIGSKGAVYTGYSGTNKLGVRKVSLGSTSAKITSELVSGNIKSGYLHTKYK